MSSTERSQMPQLPLSVNACQHQPTPQNVNNRTKKHPLYCEKFTRPNSMYLLWFWFQMVKQRKEKVKLDFGSLFPGAVNKHVTFICRSTGCTRKCEHVLKCVINVEVFLLSGLFQACIDFYCLLMFCFSLWTEEEAKPKFKWVHVQT